MTGFCEIVLFTTCAIFSAIFGILVVYVAMCSINIANKMVIAIIFCRISVMCVLLFLWVYWSNSVSAMSHPKSGILLAGTGFLPSLVFPTCSSSYSLHTFFCHRYFLDVPASYFGCVAMIVFDFHLILSQESYYAEIFVLGLKYF